MKTSILSKLVGRRKEAKEKKRIFNLSEARVEEHYAFGDIIGQGNFGKVKMGTHFKTNKKVAIKIIEKTNDVKLDSLKTEVKILMNVKHQNIVSLLDVFEDEDRLYLIMELMTGGELFERICKDYPNGYSEREAADLSRQIIESVKYLHSKGIIHRDLKPENLLLAAANDATTSTQVKISDFGLAKIWSGDALARTTCGSPNYVAPEVLLNEVRGYTSVVDMWSVGVIIYVLLCGFCPFFDENTPTLFKSIIAGQYTFPDPYWKDISSEAKEFIRKLLVVNPDHRMTPDQALKHPWIADNRHNAPIADIARNMEHFKATRSSANLKQLDNEDEDDD